MPNICYTPKRFKPATLKIIYQANAIIKEYMAEGYDLTLRQLYYQFVSRDLISNTQRSYKNLGAIINNGRLAGMIDWNSLVDRTRNLQDRPHWNSPGSIIKSAAHSYNVDLWKNQRYRPEVWIEKDALLGVISQVCTDLDVPYFSCRGYTSQSEMWTASQRLLGYIEQGQQPIIFHLGDHDPSGIDMTRDIKERLTLFLEKDIEDRDLGRSIDVDPVIVDRIALTMDQIDEYSPPPNPAKITDPRAKQYIEEYGNKSWELDALEPSVMAALIEQSVDDLIDDGERDECVYEEKAGRAALTKAADKWTDIETFLGTC